MESIEKRPECKTVYNIEVEGDHGYRVGESGVLVHNQSVPALADLVRITARMRAATKTATGWGRLARGLHNLGLGGYQADGAKQRTDVVQSSADGHSEEAILAAISGCVVWIFTERGPCPTCGGLVDERSEAQGHDIVVLFMVDYVPGLAQHYEQGGSLEWDTYLLSDGTPNSYQQLGYFHLNTANFFDSEWYLSPH